MCNKRYNTIELANQSDINTCLRQHITLVLFGASLCHPCQVQWPLLFQAVESSPYPITLAQVDVEEHQSLASQYQIHGLPTILLFCHGVLFKQFIGVQTTEDILAAVQEACD